MRPWMRIDAGAEAGAEAKGACEACVTIAQNEKDRPGMPEAALRMVSGGKCRSRSLYRLINQR